MYAPSTGNDYLNEIGIWSEPEWTLYGLLPSRWRHYFSCPSCGYHCEAIDESKTGAGFSILLLLARSHVCTA